jgi:hypothetical protein
LLNLLTISLLSCFSVFAGSTGFTVKACDTVGPGWTENRNNVTIAIAVQ